MRREVIAVFLAFLISWDNGIKPTTGRMCCMKIVKSLWILAIVLSLSGCYTSAAVSREKYWALPVAVPADAALLPAQVLLMSVFGDALSAK